MKVLVIPDVHLKPQMFRQAAAIMNTRVADRAVCLMDIPDDWDREYDIALYEETYDEAIRFAARFPDTAWCYGNHDLSYFWLFSHGGVLNYFVEEYVPKSKYHDVDAVVEEINKLGRLEMWNDMSPVWLRPQRPGIRLYKPRKLLQVVGHTPMDKITREKNLISTDVFSTYRDGRPIGTQEFLLLDTVTWEYKGVKCL